MGSYIKQSYKNTHIRHITIYLVDLNHKACGRFYDSFFYKCVKKKNVKLKM